MTDMTTLSTASKRRPGRRQEGVGLIEVMVTLLLVAVLFNGLMEIFLSSRATYSATDNITRLQENGRTAVDLLVVGLRRSGYLGGNSDISTINGSLAPITPAVGTCVTDDASWVRMIEWGVHGLNDTEAGYDCIKDDWLRGDVMTLRYASPWQVETADFVNTRIYLRSSLFEGKLFLGTDTADILNKVEDEPQRQHQMLAYTYYVRNTGRTCNGAAVPGLFREALDADNQPVAEELIAGVENIQFQYHIGDRYVDADGVTDWGNLASIKMWVLVRSECPETGYTDARTYVLGDFPNYTPADSYRRSLYSTVVALRN
jgi:type IV pilus assembly protein PilW